MSNLALLLMVDLTKVSAAEAMKLGILVYCLQSSRASCLRLTKALSTTMPAMLGSESECMSEVIAPMPCIVSTSAPQSDGGHGLRVPEVLDDCGHVLLFEEPERDVLALRLSAAAEVEGEELNVHGQQYAL